MWEKQSAVSLSLEEFVAEVRKVFEALVSRREAARKLLQLRQDTLCVADYMVDFRTLAAECYLEPGSAVRHVPAWIIGGGKG